jgi:hypothetical protein
MGIKELIREAIRQGERLEGRISGRVLPVAGTVDVTGHISHITWAGWSGRCGETLWKWTRIRKCGEGGRCAAKAASGAALENALAVRGGAPGGRVRWNGPENLEAGMGELKSWDWEGLLGGRA